MQKGRPVYYEQLVHTQVVMPQWKAFEHCCWRGQLTLADSGSASNRFVCWPMATPLTQVVVVNPFLRDITLVPCKFSIRNFFLRAGEDMARVMQDVTSTYRRHCMHPLSRVAKEAGTQGTFVL